MALDAERQQAYFCPACEEPVVFKAGRSVIHHFAHRPGHWCAFGTGESIRHHEMKAAMGSFLVAYAPDYELALIPERRADVVLAQQHLVVECQASKISTAEWEQRTRDYNRAGWAVLWVWDFKRFGNEYDGEWRVPDEIRLCHKEAFGRVYIMQQQLLYAGHLSSLWRSNDWDEGPVGYYPKTLRAMTRKDLPLPLRPQRIRSASGLWLAGFGEGVWWKPKSRT